MFSLFMTLRLWGINPRTWLTAYLEACAANGGQPPASLSAFLPWTMDADRLAQMRRGAVDPADPIDSS
jgi:transposase